LRQFTELIITEKIIDERRHKEATGVTDSIVRDCLKRRVKRWPD
jgi:hypothetical protein